MAAMGKNKAPVRGATPRSPGGARPPRRALPWRRALAWLPAVAVLAVLAGLYQAVQAMLSLPVSRVAINGEFNYVARAAVEKQLQPLLHQGLAVIDLAAIRQQLEAEPWVDRARVERRWPDYLQISISEQQPIARWGDDAYLNHRGELFRPRPMVQIDGLARLAGPDRTAGEVMQQYRNLSELLRDQGLVLSGLATDDRGAWVGEFSSGARIVLGQTQVMEKMQHFLRVYQLDLASRFDRVRRIDMRYSNGLAVDWQNG